MEPKTVGLLTWLAQLLPVTRLVCLLRGHDDHWRNDPGGRTDGRKYLHCIRCRRDTPGWQLDQAKARRLRMNKVWPDPK